MLTLQIIDKSIIMHCEGRHTPRDILRTSVFVCTYRTDVAGTVRKLVHTKRILSHFYVVAGTVCKISAHGATQKTGVILSLIHEAGIQTS